MGLFSFLHIFADLFNSANKAWHKLEPEIQTALLKGSGIIHIVNENLEGSPMYVVELIGQKLGLKEDEIKKALDHASSIIGIAQGIDSPDLETTMKNLQAYLKTKQGNVWQTASSILAQILSVALAPAGTEFPKIVLLVEYVYNRFIKK